MPQDHDLGLGACWRVRSSASIRRPRKTLSPPEPRVSPLSRHEKAVFLNVLPPKSEVTSSNLVGRASQINDLCKLSDDTRKQDSPWTHQRNRPYWRGIGGNLIMPPGRLRKF